MPADEERDGDADRWERPDDPPGDEAGVGTTREDGSGDGDADDAGDDESAGNVAGQFHPSQTVEPGTPKLENALFVVLGAYVAVLGLTRLFVDQAGFSAQDLLVLTAGVVLISVVFLGFFGVLTPDT